MLWKSLDEMYADSEEFEALTGSLPTINQLVTFAERKRCTRPPESKEMGE